MKKTIIIRNDDQKKRVWQLLQELPDSDKELHEVIIQPHKESLSSRQRRLYWRWITIISEKIGHTKDELHLEYKKTYLIKIFQRDDKEYSELIETVNQLHLDGKKRESAIIAREVIKMTSITRTNTKQMAEYMHDVEMHVGEFHRINLPHPEDRGRE